MEASAVGQRSKHERGGDRGEREVKTRYGSRRRSGVKRRGEERRKKYFYVVRK